MQFLGSLRLPRSQQNFNGFRPGPPLPRSGATCHALCLGPFTPALCHSEPLDHAAEIVFGLVPLMCPRPSELCLIEAGASNVRVEHMQFGSG